MDFKNTPIPVRRALKKLGQDLREARKRRRIPMWLAAERASISRTTLGRMEKGDEGVSIVVYGKMLFVLGMVGRLEALADIKFDEIGQTLSAEDLPERIRIPQKEKRKE
jgi:hypothetical protein